MTSYMKRVQKVVKAVDPLLPPIDIENANDLIMNGESPWVNLRQLVKESSDS